MTKVFDYTKECFDGDYGRFNISPPSMIWIHRIGPGIGSSAVDIARFFISGEGKSYTGGNMAYHYINTPEQVQQALPLDECGAHARRWGNAFGYGVAQLGNFNKHAPNVDQWNRAVDLCADLIPRLVIHSTRMWSLLPEHLRNEIPVVGHGEVPAAYGATSGKEQPHGTEACPGRLWNMDEFRYDVRTIMLERANNSLHEFGHSFTRGAKEG